LSGHSRQAEIRLRLRVLLREAEVQVLNVTRSAVAQELVEILTHRAQRSAAQRSLPCTDAARARLALGPAGEATVRHAALSSSC
jgi:hypothetical protein